MDTHPSLPHPSGPLSWRELACILAIAGITCVTMGVALANTWNIHHTAREMQRDTAQVVAQRASHPTLHQRLNALEDRLRALEERLTP